jgi:hypothetical protein
MTNTTLPSDVAEALDEVTRCTECMHVADDSIAPNIVRAYIVGLHMQAHDQAKEIDRLQEQLHAGTEVGWHALRNERDALRARIEAAPVVTVGRLSMFETGLVYVPVEMNGKRVRLVVEDDNG